MEDQFFTIVVADDEAELCDAVCSMIHWEELGFRLVGSAGNGLDALQQVEKLQPDLLLTDIQMPYITGTALARQVRELQPLIQVAFLSGYDNFEYAQSAIDSDVIAYLLKPISMAELTEALREIHSKMAARFEFAQIMGIRKNPGFASLCVKCGKCEMHCPQHLPIREKLQEADKHLRPWWMKVGVDVARKFMVKGD